MILSFINIRKVPQEMLKTSGIALSFQHLPQDLVNVNESKIMFDPYIQYWDETRCSGATEIEQLNPGVPDQRQIIKPQPTQYKIFWPEPSWSLSVQLKKAAKSDVHTCPPVE